MASKISLTLNQSVKWTDGNSVFTVTGTDAQNPAGALCGQSIQAITGSYTALDLFSITPGTVAFRNESLTDTIFVASDSAGAHVVATLAPKGIAVLQTNVTAFWAKDNTGTSADITVFACQA